LKDAQECVVLTNGRLLSITMDNTSSHFLITREPQSTIKASGIESPALMNHILCMAQVIQLALGSFMRSLGVKGCTKSWEANEHIHQFGENESIDIGMSQSFQNEGNA
jgi:hypothetical protein